jgi:hypothetical protein
MSKILQFTVLVFFIMATANCSWHNPDENGCFGYWYDPGLKRGTLLKNQNYVTPYRQCVDEAGNDRGKRPHG